MAGGTAKDMDCTNNRFMALSDLEDNEMQDSSNSKTPKNRPIKRNFLSEADDGPKKKTGNNNKESSTTSMESSINSKLFSPNNFRFSNLDKAPFKAIVSLKKEFIKEGIPAPGIMTIGRDLNKKYNITYDSIERKSKYAWSISFNNRGQANNAISNALINNSDCPLRIEVPWFTTHRRFVIRGIPTDVTDDELIEELKHKNHNLNIEEVYRFQKRIFSEGKSTLTNTTTSKITIRGHSVPSHVTLWGAKIPTDTFIPSIRRCFKCGQLSHATKFCKNTSKCLRCGQNYDASHEVCSLPAKCINCEGNHPTLDNGCPEIEKKKRITALMATENIDFNEARKSLYPRWPTALHQSSSAFPILNRVQPIGQHAGKGTHNQSSDIDLSTHPTSGFADMLKSNGTNKNSSKPALLSETPTIESLFNLILKLATKLDILESRFFNNDNLSLTPPLTLIMLRIIQWNCQSLTKKLPELEFRSQNFELIMLSETWLRKSDRINIKNFDILRSDRNLSRGGGVAILINNSIKYSHVDLTYNCNNKLECCAIEITWSQKSLILVSIYKPPDVNVLADEWQKFFMQFQHDVIIGGDTNAHHIQWGNNKNNLQGTNLWSAISQSNICLLNDGSHTYRPHWRPTSTAIDLTLASPRITGALNWTVINENWGSDHAPIDIKLIGNVSYSSRFQIINKPYNVKTDWATLETNFIAQENNLENLIKDPMIDTQVKYSTFMATIVDCVVNGTPGRRSADKSLNIIIDNKQRKLCPWWNEQCERLIRLRKAAYLKFKFKPSSENLTNYTNLASQTKKELRHYKKTYFQNFCNTLNRNSSMKYIWNKVKAISNSYNRKEDSNAYNEKSKSAVRDAIDDLCPPWAELAPPDFSGLPLIDLFEMPFDVTELNAVLHNAKSKSSPGLDGVDYYILKKLTPKLKDCLLSLLNGFYLSGGFPKEWEEFLIFFILKNNSERMRPISLAQATLKILEKMLYFRLYWWVEHQNILPKNQFGFRKDSSCTDNLAILTANIKRNQLLKQDTAALFLDIKGAYDNVLCDVLINNLIGINLSQSAITFIYNLIHRRKVTVRFNDIECKRVCFKGLPQGSVLSPLLYSLYVANIESSLPPDSRVKLIQFADDICLLSSSRNTEKAVKDLEKNTREIADWLANKGLFLAEHKT